MQRTLVAALATWLTQHGASAQPRVTDRRLLRKDDSTHSGTLGPDAAPEDVHAGAIRVEAGEQRRQMGGGEALSAIEQEDSELFSSIVSPFHDVPRALLPRLQRLDMKRMALQEQSQVRVKRSISKGVLKKLDPEQENRAKRKLTTWNCLPAHASNLHREDDPRMTCKFQNLYYAADGHGHGFFEAHTLRSNTSTIPSMSSGVGSNFNDCHYDIVQREHNSIEEFFYSTLESPDEHKEQKGLTLMFWPLYHFNIGHGLFDGLYPAFVSLLQHGEQHTPFRPLLLGGRLTEIAQKCKVCFTHVEDVFGQIGRVKTLPSSELESAAKPTLHNFEEAILGVGTNSAKIDANVNYSLGACRELDACRHFRDRVYDSLELPNRGLRQVVRKKPPFRIKVVFNTRFQGQWPCLVEFLLNASKGSVLHDCSWNANNGKTQPVWQNTSWEFMKDFEVEGVVWTPESSKPKVQGMNRKGVQIGDFKGHIKTISETDVHVSSPGTAQMYQTFLPDGAVHINMGEGDIGYMEEYMAEGAPYLRALYYPRRKYDTLFRPHHILGLLQEAHTLLKNGLSGPVPVNQNLSPLGRVAKAFAFLLHGKEIAQGKPPAMQREVQGVDWLGNDFASVRKVAEWGNIQNGEYYDELAALLRSYDQHHKGGAEFFEDTLKANPRMARHRLVDMRKYMDLASVI